MNQNKQQPTALISCFDKTGLEQLGKKLTEAGWRIISTGGTAARLQEAGIDVIPVEDVTGHPSMFGGRIKTLHPAVHAGILARRKNPDDIRQLRERGYNLLDMVVVNLYPFEQVAKKGAVESEVLENIDIGGPTLLRAAAKNYRSVICLSDPREYDEVVLALTSGDGVDPDWRRRLAARAFGHVSRYDSLIAGYLGAEDGGLLAFPDELTLPLEREMDLRYGENPHQSAAFYSLPSPPAHSLVRAEHVSGPDLSYNNLADADAAVNAVCEFNRPAVCALKHANPCGLAVADQLPTAFSLAYQGDPVSIFGGVVAVNRTVCEKFMQFMSDEELFLDMLIAPDYTEGAREKLKKRGKLTALQLRGLNPENREDTSGEILGDSIDGKFLAGGMLLSSADDVAISHTDWTVAGEVEPSAQSWSDLEFAMKVVKHVKSNSVVVAKGGATLGVGAGQMNRVEAARLALDGAGGRAEEAVLASDGFLPFPDVAKLAAGAGIAAIVQPGGSIRDDESIAVADDAGMAMIFTGRRHFRH